MHTKFKIASCVLVGVILLLIHLAVPSFYQTVWRLAGSGDIAGAAEFLRSFGIWSMAISFAVLVIINTLGFLPNFFILAANGIVFGIIEGTILSWAGECVGAALGFWFMRTTFRDYALSVMDRAGYLHQIEEFSSHKGFQTVLLTRALPYVPAGLITAAGALSCISFKDYMIATIIGKLPSAWIEVMAGHDLADYEKNTTRLTVIVLVMIAAYGLVWWQKRKRKAT